MEHANQVKGKQVVKTCFIVLNTVASFLPSVMLVRVVTGSIGGKGLYPQTATT